MTKAFMVLLREKTDEDGETQLQAIVRDCEETPKEALKLEAPKFKRGMISDKERAGMYAELFIAVARAMHERSIPTDARYFQTPPQEEPVNGKLIILPNGI